MSKVHYVPSYLYSNIHPVSINLIGTGGTGSHVLSCLARIHCSLKALGMQGLKVVAYDPDTVSTTNVGRQLFTHADIGMNKAACLIEKINRIYGLQWYGVPTKYKIDSSKANITISCVDSIKSRIEIGDTFKYGKEGSGEMLDAYYWLDCGNSKRSGQIILGTLESISQPPSTSETQGKLPTFIEEYPNAKDEGDDTPSCSTHEALMKQDLFINSIIANYAGQMLW